MAPHASTMKGRETKMTKLPQEFQDMQHQRQVAGRQQIDWLMDPNHRVHHEQPHPHPDQYTGEELLKLRAGRESGRVGSNVIKATIAEDSGSIAGALDTV